MIIPSSVSNTEVDTPSTVVSVAWSTPQPQLRRPRCTLALRPPTNGTPHSFIGNDEVPPVPSTTTTTAAPPRSGPRRPRYAPAPRLPTNMITPLCWSRQSCRPARCRLHYLVPLNYHDRPHTVPMYAHHVAHLTPNTLAATAKARVRAGATSAHVPDPLAAPLMRNPLATTKEYLNPRHT